MVLWVALSFCLPALAAEPAEDALLDALLAELTLDHKRSALQDALAKDTTSGELRRVALIAYRLLDALEDAEIRDARRVDAWLSLCLSGDPDAVRTVTKAIASPERLATPPGSAPSTRTPASERAASRRLPPRPEIEGALPVAIDESFVDALLDNGVRLTVVGDPWLTRVAVVHRVAMGSAHEQPGESGLAHLLEHLVFDRGATGAPGAYWTFMDEHGGFANAYTRQDDTTYYAEVPPEHLADLIELEVDRFSNRRFDPAAVRREINVVADEIRRGQLESSQRVARSLYRATYAGHPYQEPVAGTEAEVLQATPEALSTFAERAHRGGRLHVVVVGPFEPEAVVERLTDYGELPGGDPSPALPAFDQSKKRIRVGDAARRHRLKGVMWPLPPQQSCEDGAARTCIDDHWADLVALQVLGSDGRSRLQGALSSQGGMLVPVTFVADRGQSGGFVALLGERRSPLANTGHNVGIGFLSLLSGLLGGQAAGVMRTNPTSRRVREAVQEDASWLTRDIVDGARDKLVVGLMERTWSPSARAIAIADWAAAGLPLSETAVVQSLDELLTMDIRKRYRAMTQGKGVRIRVR